MPEHDSAGNGTMTEHRRVVDDRSVLAGVAVREDDVEPVKGIRAIALLFRGMSILLLLLMVLQVVFGLTSTVPASPGVLFAEAVRLVIFAGLLWGAGDLGVLWVKSHHDLRATRILVARLTYMVKRMGESTGHLPREESDVPRRRSP